jgi:predicted PurR-regulated permease PerM
VPALLLAFEVSPTQVLYVAALYLAVQQLEGNLITPLVQQEAVSLPPALTLVVMVMMGVLFGVLGILVAAPLTAITLVVVKMLYLDEAPGERGDEHVIRRKALLTLEGLRKHFPSLRRV